MIGCEGCRYPRGGGQIRERLNVFNLTKGLRGDLIPAYKDLPREPAADNNRLFRLAEEGLMRSSCWNLTLDKLKQGGSLTLGTISQWLGWILPHWQVLNQDGRVYSKRGSSSTRN